MSAAEGAPNSSEELAEGERRRLAHPRHRGGAVEGVEGSLEAGDAGERLGAVAVDELALARAVAGPRPGQPSGSTLARARIAPEQPMAPARWIRLAWPVYTPDGDLVGFEDQPLGVAGAVLDAGDRELREEVDRDAWARHLREVVGEHRHVDRGGDALVVRVESTTFGGESTRRASAPSSSARFDSTQPGGPMARRCRRARAPGRRRRCGPRSAGRCARRDRGWRPRPCCRRPARRRRPRRPGGRRGRRWRARRSRPRRRTG